MAYFDRHTAATLAGRALIIIILVFMTCMIVAWWYSVLRFFFYDHWKPTAWVAAVTVCWYVIGRALEEFVNRTEGMSRRRPRRDCGDDDCA